jgi:hypothetical protein
MKHVVSPKISGGIPLTPMKALLAQFARVICSIPMSEAENERIFSIRKFIVGKPGGRSKNELMAARTRLEMRAGNAVK